MEVPSVIFGTIVDRIETGVYALNLEGKVFYWNHGAEQITGYLGQEVLGREYRGDSSNRRISLIVQYIDPSEGNAGEAKDPSPDSEKQQAGEKAN
ncbi:MAG TPA: PAS domain-containing protein [Terriglobales bacterium]|nr:PAS domain-containing protein [Terriglobales bacterium]